MIRIDQSEIEAKGDSITLLSELSFALEKITEKLSEELDKSQNDLIEGCVDAVRFGTLKKAGMTREEAFRVITGREMKTNSNDKSTS